MRVVDVNILVNVVNQSSPRHGELKDWWEESLRGSERIGLAWAVIVGFLRIVTDHRILPHPLPLEASLEKLNTWLDHPNIILIVPAEGHAKLLTDLLREAGRAGDLTPDAHLAALAIGSGATLASCDTDFARFSKLRWENPLASA